jgi:hypothetical protein
MPRPITRPLRDWADGVVMKQSRANLLEVSLVFLLFAGVSLTSAAVQHPNGLNRGLGWDGCSYYSMADQIAHGSKPQGPAPFIYRVGTSFLAAQLGPHNLMRGFLVANVIAAGLIAALLVLWLRLFIENWKLRLLLVALFLTQWHGPTRFVYFYPDNNDPWGLLFCLAGLICIQKLRANLSPNLLGILCIICFVGLMFREFVGLVGVAAICTLNLLYYERGLRIRRPVLALLVPLGCAFLGLAASHHLVIRGLLPHPISACGETYSRTYSFIVEGVYWMHYQPLVMYIHGWLLAFGPILFLLIFGWREVGRFLGEHQYQLAYLAGVIGLSWVGGPDTERFAFFAMPVIYLLCGKVIARNSVVLRSGLLISFLASIQAISERLFWTIPDYPGVGQPGPLNLVVTPPEPSWFFLVPFGNVSYLNLLSHFGRNMMISFVEYCFLGFTLLVWLHYRQRRLVPGQHSRGQ